ncbi:FERM, ARH/RhoGEF and pleckstrin domain protein 2 [Phyllostomus discolor]|uniref:FERM, ARH/RhoGEF and pleckstrin domain protein 2 n=1 Tax=Phyllostomus discolor TaxID=89673 RepID=A0A834EED5_9CHIR|nr:FERM, ARH/RhoGEF and pleckstrin domain protein 2 [Phyllostomus discolor]
MGEIEGTYRALQTPGARLGAQPPAGVSTLEPRQAPSVGPARTAAGTQEKCLLLRVKLLDSSVEMFDVEPKCDGQLLLTRVWRRLNLIECDYFGLEFQNVPSYWVWLEPMKPIIRQVRRPKSAVFRLAVKFFPPDPGQLQEEYTRYLFALQLKRDLLEERLTCSDATAALLTSHLLQAEIGDYDETLDREHLKANQYLPHQERCLEKILELHRKHTGQTPAESDFQVLEVARKLEMYGVRFHKASDREGTKISLAVSHMGVLVFQCATKINTFNWSRVRKLSFKRKRFLIKLHPEVHGPYQDTLEFLLGSRDECKNFWKICVEYHTFFRLLDQPKPKAKAVFFSRGSSFRYSGRTQKQLVDYVRDGAARRTPYERSHSRVRTPSHALTAELPKQSISFTEGLRTPGSPPSTPASCFSAPASPAAPPGRPGVSDAPTEPPAPHTRRPAAEKSRAAPDGPGARQALAPGPPALQPCQGAGFCQAVRSRSPDGPRGQSRGGADQGAAGAGREHRAAGKRDPSEGGLAAGSPPSTGECPPEPQGSGGAPVFTLTNAPLQVSEEFIDDDPADISFFAGGAEAFSCPYGGLALRGSRCGRPGSARSSPDRCSVEAVPVSLERGFEFGGEGGFGGVHPADTSELLEVKAQASLMQSLLSPSESSSLRNGRSLSSSLGHLPLLGLSAQQSEASSMANFPACSVRSEASSAFQFSDILDQLEQLSCPPTTADDSSSSEADSWGSEPEAPLDISLFLGGPFAPGSGERVVFELQSSVQSVRLGEQVDKSPC